MIYYLHIIIVLLTQKYITYSVMVDATALFTGFTNGKGPYGWIMSTVMVMRIDWLTVAPTHLEIIPVVIKKMPEYFVVNKLQWFNGL